MAADAGIPLFDTEIEQRIAYAEALTMGKTIFEWAGPASAAVHEIQKLTHELLDAFHDEDVHTSTEAAATFA